MKLEIKGSAEGLSLKKLLLICILIMCITFISGCIDEEKNTETSTSSQISLESDSRLQDSILKQKDIPGRELKKYRNISAPKSSNVIYGTDYLNDWDRYETETKKIGELSEWEGRMMTVYFSYLKYDSNENFPTKDSNVCKDIGSPQFNIFYNMSVLEDMKNSGDDNDFGILDYECPNIGDHSIHIFSKSKSKYAAEGIYTSTLMYTYKNYIVYIIVEDDEEHYRSEALRIAKLVESRLD